RLSISTTYWPLVWAPPQPVTLTVVPGTSGLVLPVRAERDEDATLRDFGEPMAAPPLELERLEPGHDDWRVIRELAENLSHLEVIRDTGRVRIVENGMEMYNNTRETYSCRENDFSSFRGEVLTERGLKRDDWAIHTVTRTILSCDADSFFLVADLDAYEGEKRVFARTWDRRIPRDFI
ncbi:MAG: peptidase S15, partial [Hydrogenovibrio crunogenus]|nr:peptidase S15 [Hydrogenovibrio crunogenus]